jgi:hypothetical protein
MDMFNPEKQYARNKGEYENTTALPNAVKYSQLMPKAVAGRGSMRKFQSSNGNTYNQGANIIRIDVNADMGAFLDGQHGELEFKISATNKTTNEVQYIDTGGWAWIQRLRIEADGIELERIDNYNLLQTKLFQYQSNKSHLLQTNATQATGNCLIASAADGTTTQLSQDWDTSKCAVKFAGNTSASDKTLCVPLVSGFLSNTGNKYIPLGSSRGFTLELTLATPNSFLFATTECEYQISNVSYNAPIVYITGNEFLSNWSNVLQNVGGVAWSGHTFKNYVSSISTGAGEKIVNINDRSRSLKSILTIIRTQANVNDKSKFGLGNSTLAGATAYNYRIGDLTLPPSRVLMAISASQDTEGSNVAKAFNEVQKALGQMNSLNAGGLVSLKNYQSIDTNATSVGMGIFGLDCEAYLSDAGISSSGIDTASNGLQVSFEMTGTAVAESRVDTFCMIDAIYHLDENGSFSVSQ